MLRGLAGLTQHELGRLLGVQQRTIAKLELDAFKPSVIVEGQLCEVFSITRDWLMRGNVPVFSRPAVLFVLSHFPKPGRRIGMIARLLESHLAAFLTEVKVSDVWSPLNEVFIFKCQSTLFFFSTGLFGQIVAGILNRLPISWHLTSFIPAGNLASWRDFAQALSQVAAEIGVESSQAPALIQSIEEHGRRMEAIQQDTVRSLREKIRELLEASGLSADEVLLPILRELHGQGDREPERTEHA